MNDLLNGWPAEGEPMVRVPVFREDILNEGTPDECIVHRADNKVFKVIYAFGPITRFLLKRIH